MRRNKNHSNNKGNSNNNNKGNNKSNRNSNRNNSLIQNERIAVTKYMRGGSRRRWA